MSFRFQLKESINISLDNENCAGSIPKLLNSFAHHFFWFSLGISLCAIEEIYASIVCSFHAVKCLFWALLLEQKLNRAVPDLNYPSPHGHHMLASHLTRWPKLEALNGRGNDIPSWEGLLNPLNPLYLLIILMKGFEELVKSYRLRKESYSKGNLANKYGTFFACMT